MRDGRVETEQPTGSGFADGQNKLELGPASHGHATAAKGDMAMVRPFRPEDIPKRRKAQNAKCAGLDE
jgi:hypothetical protein